MTITKNCRKCRQDLELECYNPCNLGKHGKSSTCKECLNKKTIKGKQENKTPLEEAKTAQKRPKPTGEAIMFARIWNKQPHICKICGNGIPKAKTYSFAHICNKGMFKSLRLFENNIALVCSINCHNEVDRKVNNYKRILEKHILNGEVIDFNKLDDYL